MSTPCDQITDDLAALVAIGEVIGVHIDKALLKDGLFDTFGAAIVQRAGGPTAYAEMLPESRFDLRRPQ